MMMMMMMMMTVIRPCAVSTRVCVFSRSSVVGHLHRNQHGWFNKVMEKAPLLPRLAGARETDERHEKHSRHNAQIS